jgi:tetratricopeptide (TPR) repeat protein
MTPPFELEPGTPLAGAISRGQQAFAHADVPGGDAAYREAVGLVPAGEPALWAALAVDHVAELHAEGGITPALKRCDEYLRAAEGRHLQEASISLRLLRAEIRSSVGDHAGIDADLAPIRSALQHANGLLTPDETARLHRLEGLVAAAQGRLREAERHLQEAERIFAGQDDRAGVDAIGRDRLMIAVRYGDESGVASVVDGPSPRTVPDHLLLALALKGQVRYEEAIRVLQGVLALDLDPAWRFTVIRELFVLLRLTADDEAADGLLPLLREAASLSPDPEAAAAVVERFSVGSGPGADGDPAFDATLQRARRLIVEGRLDEAERLVVELRPRTQAGPDVASWHLAAGELELSRSEVPETRDLVAEAVEHLRRAASSASTTALIEVRVRALRLLGRAEGRLGDDDRATSAWAEAHRLEEHIAARQLTDATRIRMLHAVADEHDERIRAAAAALRRRGVEATAAVVVALEAARGSAILGRILPDGAAIARDLPAPSDLIGSWRWVNAVAGGLPRSQVAWLMHSTPDEVHHALVGRGFLHHASVPSARHGLEDAIDGLAACWEDQGRLERSIRRGDFDQLLAEVAFRTGIDAVLQAIPPGVRRIAVVAGGALSDVPLAGMAVPVASGPIGLRFALSSLPCLSARVPLRRRSRGLRGDEELLVSPPAAGLTAPGHTRRSTVLEGEYATREALQAELEGHRHRRVRIDSHGGFDPANPVQSWLQLAPEGLAGRLAAGDLQSMDLRTCGTLVLGACESGMAQRIGREERMGFVRAAFHGGAAAVVAARWAAEEAAAATVLDGFDRYVRYLPRDLALRQAQLDVCAGAPDSQPGALPTEHPARWACWMLWGDAGFQTRTGPVRRSLRRRADERRRRAARG